jgi:methylated-DNA-protein-cysteine methyltransferase-like protein
LRKRTVSQENLYSRIYAQVKVIPAGKVCTYGQIAHSAGLGKNYRLIGYALHRLPDHSGIPWHRVVNRYGKISYAPSRGGHDHLQQRLLQEEGIVFDKDNKIDLLKYGYRKSRISLATIKSKKSKKQED